MGLPSGLFPSVFPTKTLYTPLLSTIRATCPTHLILLDMITRTILGEQFRSWSSSIRNFLHSPVTSSFLGPNIVLNILFSNTLNLRSSLNVSDQVSHPYRTTSKIPVLYILIFIFFDMKLEDKRFCSEWRRVIPWLQSADLPQFPGLSSTRTYSNSPAAEHRQCTCTICKAFLLSSQTPLLYDLRV
jgi:hypothetical protein